MTTTKSWLQLKLEEIGNRELGHGPRAHSSRATQGKSWLALDVRDQDDAYSVMITLGAMSYEDDHPITAPLSESYGHGLVLYWPNVSFV